MRQSTGSIKRIWSFLGKPSFSMWLIFMIFLDLILGSLIMKRHPKVFFALQNNLLQDWMRAYGINEIDITWWFFVLLILLFILSITSTVCAINRINSVIKGAKGVGLKVIIHRLSTSIIHFGFLFLLIGQLLSHTLSTNLYGKILYRGSSMVLPDSAIRMVLKDLNIQYFRENSPFIGMEGTARDVSATFLIHDRGRYKERKISSNSPLRYRGWAIFIEDFSPKSLSINKSPFICVRIKRDRGVGFMLFGATLFGSGLMLYLFGLKDKRRFLVFLITFIAFSGGCSHRFEQYGEFSVRFLKGGYKEITDGIGRRFLLVPRGKAPLKGYGKAGTIYVPIKSAVIYSTYNAALIKELGHLDTIRGVIVKEKDWFIPEIKEGLRSGNIAYLGEYTSIDFEKLKKVDPDVVFTWDEGIIPKLEELSIPCIITSTRIAKDLDSHINFIRFIATFYNEEDKAKEFTEAQFNKIREISSKIERYAKRHPKVIWGDIYARKVLVEPGNSWAAQVAKLAGCRYLFDDLEGASCMQVTIEKFFSRIKDADILITYRGPESGITSKEMLKSSSRLLQNVNIRPLSEGEIFFTGYRLYQVSDTSDIIYELASLFHPEIFPQRKERRYFFRLPAR